MFTVAFVTTVEEANQMLSAGADVVCVHLGLTKGGFLGAKNYIPIEKARRLTDQVFQICKENRPEALRMIYVGPASTSTDMRYMYKNSECQGYIGGSAFDRISTERAIYDAARESKRGGDYSDGDVMNKVVVGGWNPRDYTEFVKQYIADHYMDEILLGNLALVAHVSLSYLSIRFKRETGVSFTEYLIRYRLEKAKEMFRSSTDSCRQIAENVGYGDYAQFSKIFKKYESQTPMEYRESAAS